MKTTLLSGLLLLTTSATALADEYLTFFMGGQSNMVGYGKTKDLPESLKGLYEKLYHIFQLTLHHLVMAHNNNNVFFLSCFF